MISGLLKKIFGDRNTRVLKDLWPYVDKINELVANPSLRNKMSTANMELIESKYSYSVICRKLLKLFDEKPSQ